VGSPHGQDWLQVSCVRLMSHSLQSIDSVFAFNFIHCFTRRTMAALQILLVLTMCTWTLSDSKAPGSFGKHLKTSDSINETLFTIWICIIFFCIGGNFAIFPTGTAIAFGPQYVSSIYGLVFMACTFSNVIGVVLSSELQDALGWGMLTLMVGSLVIAGFCVNMFLRIQPPCRETDF